MAVEKSVAQVSIFTTIAAQKPEPFGVRYSASHSCSDRGQVSRATEAADAALHAASDYLKGTADSEVGKSSEDSLNPAQHAVAVDQLTSEGANLRASVLIPMKGHDSVLLVARLTLMRQPEFQAN